MTKPDKPRRYRLARIIDDYDDRVLDAADRIAGDSTSAWRTLPAMLLLRALSAIPIALVAGVVTFPLAAVVAFTLGAPGACGEELAEGVQCVSWDTALVRQLTLFGALVGVVFAAAWDSLFQPPRDPRDHEARAAPRENETGMPPTAGGFAP